MKGFTAIEKVVAFVVVFLMVFTLITVLRMDPPDNYRFDPYTQSATWTDPQGRTLIQSPDGTIRELSREGR